MGVVTDFFFAPTDALDTALLESGPGRPLAVFDCKNTDPLKLATLHTILLGERVSDTDAVLARMPDEVASHEEAWIFAVSDDFVSLLSKLPREARRDLAIAWARTEEWNLNPPHPEFNTWFDELCTFITQPRPDTDRLWIWMSL